MIMNRIGAKFFIDLSIWMLAVPLAFFLRLENGWFNFLEAILWVMLISAPIKLCIIVHEKYFRQSWHRIGIRDLFGIARGTVIYSALLLGGAVLFRGIIVIPLSVPLIEAMIIVLGMSSVRLLVRLWYDYGVKKDVSLKKEAKKVLIVGAGDAGTMIAREMLRHPEAGMKPAGFLDDDIFKRKQSFLGVEVLGKTEDVSEVISKHNVDVLLIAIPSAGGSVIRPIIEKVGDKIECKVIPAIHELLSGQVTINEIRNVNVEDLLRREPANLNTQEIAGYLEDQVVLVTGAGGSIGSEIVRQVIPFNPRKLLLLDNCEFNLYKLEQEINEAHGNLSFQPIIADVRDSKTLAALFNKLKPEVIFHAAAHKHVPLMELNPSQAILNNVVGTKNLIDLALESGIEHFVNVSTDKAVNPTSIMGASKRVAEYIVEWGSRQADNNQIFVSVRFGNVLGSSGSVVPKFSKQIKQRKAITITHPEMTRYFMTIPEASQLVLQAGGLKESGVVYALDMGEPVKILDLAKDLIRLSGLEPDIDIPIEVTGVRPGEKLFEELLTSEEDTVATRYEKIYVAQQNGLPITFNEQLEILVEFAVKNNELGVKTILSELISINELSPKRKEAVSN